MMILTSWGTFSKCQKTRNQTKLAILTITQCRREGQFDSAPSYRKGKQSQICFVYLQVRSTFPENILPKLLKSSKQLRENALNLHNGLDATQHIPTIDRLCGFHYFLDPASKEILVSETN